MPKFMIALCAHPGKFNSMLHTCRELLLAFGWLLVHDNVLEHVLKQQIHQVGITSLLPPYPQVTIPVQCWPVAMHFT